jgi:peptide/nickel transport system substrate-binding protein
MIRRSSQRRAAGVALLMAIVCAACGGSSRSSSADAASADPNGVFRKGVSMTAGGGFCFDPAKLGVSSRGQVDGYLVYGGWLRHLQDGKYEPWLAESVTIVDPKTINTKIRPNLKFSDGTPVDAAAAKRSIERNIASNNTAGIRIPELKLVSKIDVVSPTEFTIRFNTDAAGVFYLLMADVETVPISLAAIDSGADLCQKPVGAGPYMVSSFDAGTKITLSRNPNYFDVASVRVPTVEYVHVSDPASAVNGLRSGAIDYAAIPFSEAASMPSNIKSITYKNAPWWMSMCATKPPLDNILVRQALNYATDRESIASTLYGSQGEPAWGLWPSDSQYFSQDTKSYYAYNPTKAKELLTQAGYPNGIEFGAYGGGTAGDGQRLLEILQSQWAKVGVKIRILPLTITSEYFSNVRELSFTFSMVRPGVTRLTRLVTTPSVGNPCHLPVTDVDAAAAKLSAMPPGSPDAVATWNQAQVAMVKTYAFGVLIAFQVDAYAYNADRVASFKAVRDAFDALEPDLLSIFIKK